MMIFLFIILSLKTTCCDNYFDLFVIYKKCNDFPSCLTINTLNVYYLSGMSLPLWLCKLLIKLIDI